MGQGQGIPNHRWLFGFSFLTNGHLQQVPEEPSFKENVAVKALWFT
jgi:hypothetical protein